MGTIVTAVLTLVLVAIITNTSLALAVTHTPEYNAGYTAACSACQVLVEHFP
jgi:hypothetical protein